MGKLADLVLHYLDSTSSEQLQKDWEELKPYNSYGPNILDVISNYGRASITLETPLVSSEKSKVIKDDFSKSYTSSSNLCLAS